MGVTVPIKFCLQEQEVGRVRSDACCLPTPDYMLPKKIDLLVVVLLKFLFGMTSNGCQTGFKDMCLLPLYFPDV